MKNIDGISPEFKIGLCVFLGTSLLAFSIYCITLLNLDEEAFDSRIRYETVSHVESDDEIIYEDIENDYTLYATNKEPLKEGDNVYSPSLGNLSINKITDNEIFCSLGNDQLVYNGMSGERILSSDFKRVVGFVSSVEEGNLIIIRTRFNQ